VAERRAPLPHLAHPPRGAVRRHWALTIPLWISLLYVYIYWTYESINMMTVPECSSLYTIHGAGSW